MTQQLTKAQLIAKLDEANKRLAALEGKHQQGADETEDERNVNRTMATLIAAIRLTVTSSAVDGERVVALQMNGLGMAKAIEQHARGSGRVLSGIAAVVKHRLKFIDEVYGRELEDLLVLMDKAIAAKSPDCQIPRHLEELVVELVAVLTWANATDAAICPLGGYLHVTHHLVTRGTAALAGYVPKLLETRTWRESRVSERMTASTGNCWATIATVHDVPELNQGAVGSGPTKTEPVVKTEPPQGNDRGRDRDRRDREDPRRERDDRRARRDPACFACGSPAHKADACGTPHPAWTSWKAKGLKPPGELLNRGFFALAPSHQAAMAKTLGIEM